jgi:hypothetical protein
MVKRVDMDAILKANPHIRRKDLEDYRDALRELRSRGLLGHGYRLAPPFAGRRVSVEGDADQDPRTVELRSIRDQS